MWASPPPQQQQQQQQTTVNTNVVVSQPSPAVVLVNNRVGRDCLGCSITNMLLFNPVLGLIAVIFSCMARDAYEQGDSDKGFAHFKVARILNILSPLVTVGIIILVIIISSTT
ncbi:uncharacterized protein [Watersipora subatra]|uniref:uncharacterized protein n=1 Tax=Watersipora subatra TaxID=2589382 RepID=UPI00355C2F01